MPSESPITSEPVHDLYLNGRPLSGVGRRAIGQLIDMGTWYVILVAVANFAGLTQGYSPLGFDLGTVGNLLAIAGILAYFVVCEAIWGRSLGKAIVGLVVLNVDGSKMGFTGSLIRNGCRIVDAFPYCLPYLLGAGVVWNTGLRQRVGDRLAHTVVVEHATVLPGGTN